MSDTFTSSGRIQLQGTGNNNATWGAIADTQFQNLEAMITGDNGYGGGGINLTGLAAYTLTANNGTADQARQQLYPFTGTLSAPCTVTLPGVVKIGWAVNATAGNQNVILTTGGGSSIAIGANSYWVPFYCDGTNVVTIPLAAAAFAGSVLGRTNGTPAPPGTVGEYLTSTSAPLTLASGVVASVASITLSAGDWDVWGSIYISPVGGATVIGGALGTNTISTALPTWPNGGRTNIENSGPTGAGVNTGMQLWTGASQYNFANPTTVYTIATMFFVGSTTTHGFIAARRRS